MPRSEFLGLTGRAVHSGLRCYEHLREYETSGDLQQRVTRRQEQRRQQLKTQIMSLMDADVTRRVEALLKRVQDVAGDDVDMVEWLLHLVRLKEDGARGAQQDMGLGRNAVLMTAQEVSDILSIKRRYDAAQTMREGLDEQSANEYASMLERRSEWVITSDDADMLTQRIEEFVSAVRVYVRISNIKRDPNPIVTGPSNTAEHRGMVTVRDQSKKLGPFYGVFGPGSNENAVSASNDEVWSDPKIGVRNAVLDVFSGRDVLIMGYGVSGAGKTYTLLGTRGSAARPAVDGIAQHFLREAAGRVDVRSISICVKELYGLTPSLQPDLQDALMTGAVYEYCPTSFVKPVNMSWNKLSTTSSRTLNQSGVWLQDTVCGMDVERRKNRNESTGSLSYPQPFLRATNSDGPMLFTPQSMVDAEGDARTPTPYDASEPWTVIATSAPQSSTDDIIHVAEVHTNTTSSSSPQEGRPVTGLDFALSVDHFKFVNLKNGGDVVENFRSIYDRVQDLRKARALHVVGNKLFYKDMLVGRVRNGTTLGIKLVTLVEALEKYHGTDLGLRLWSKEGQTLSKRDVAHVQTYAGAQQKENEYYNFVVDERGDEGFMTSTTRDRYILPRIFQRQMASTEYRSPAIESLRSFDHEKSTPNNPESSRGNLMLIFRVGMSDGKVGYLTIADFPGVEFPENIARGFDYGSDKPSLDQIRYHPPYTQHQQGAFDKWSMPPTPEKKEADPLPLTMDQWRTVREGAFIDTMLAHLRLFLRKSSGNTASWCSTHDVAPNDVQWRGNPAFFWPSRGITHMDTKVQLPDTSNNPYYATAETNAFFRMVPVYTRGDVYVESGSVPHPEEPHHPDPTILSAPFYWSGTIWGRRMHTTKSNKKRGVNRLLPDLWDAVSDRMLFEVAAVNRWYTWYETLDDQKRTLHPEPTRRAILLIELLQAVTTRKTLFQQDRSMHKDPKIIVMNLLRADDDASGIRGAAVRKSVEYANSLRVDYQAAAAATNQAAAAGETKIPCAVRKNPPIAAPDLMTNVLAETMLTKPKRSAVDTTAITGRRWFRNQWTSYQNQVQGTMFYTFSDDRTRKRHRVMLLRNDEGRTVVRTVVGGPEGMNGKKWALKDGGLTIGGRDSYHQTSDGYENRTGQRRFKGVAPRCVVLRPPLHAARSVEEQERGIMEHTIRTIMKQIDALDAQTREAIVRRFCEGSRSSQRK